MTTIFLNALPKPTHFPDQSVGVPVGSPTEASGLTCLPAGRATPALRQPTNQL